MLYSIVGILVIILDQAVKFWVSDTLFGTDVVRFIPGVISLVNVHNDGAAFSFLSGSGARVYFIAATGVFVLLVVLALATNFIRGRFSRWCLVLVAAGGLSNMIDRVIYGYVQDMFKVELFNFAIFNVADVFITVFAILFALSMIFEKPESDMGDVLYEDDEDEEEAEAPKEKKKKEKKERKPLLGRKAKQEDDDEAVEEAAPAETLPVKNSVRNARQARQARDEQEFEQARAQQRSARKARRDEAEAPKAETPAPAARKSGEPDPYDAWLQASARAKASQADSYAGKVMDIPAPMAETPAPKPKPAPAPKPAPKAESAPKAASDEEFSLDDILAEFR